jgi:hypothetical protein
MLISPCVCRLEKTTLPLRARSDRVQSGFLAVRLTQDAIPQATSSSINYDNAVIIL